MLQLTNLCQKTQICHCTAFSFCLLTFQEASARESPEMKSDTFPLAFTALTKGDAATF